MDLVKVLSEQQLKSDLPTLKIGDTVKVKVKLADKQSRRIEFVIRSDAKEGDEAEHGKGKRKQTHRK